MAASGTLQQSNVDGSLDNRDQESESLFKIHNNSNCMAKVNSKKPLRFIAIDEKKLFQRRPYTKHKDSKKRTVDESENVQDDENSGKQIMGSAPANWHKKRASWSFRDGELPPWNTWTADLDRASSDALLFLAKQGPRCPLMRKWLPRSLHDERLLHCFLLESVSFDRKLAGDDHPSCNDASNLPFKIRAIQATNAILSDEATNTSDTALIAVVILAALERREGNIPLVLQHAKGLEAILKQRKAKGLAYEDACPWARRGIEPAIEMGKFLRTGDAGIEAHGLVEPSSIEGSSHQLRNCLLASKFCMILKASRIKCDSSLSLLDIMKKLSAMLALMETPPSEGIKRSDFRECVDLLDDLWVSQNSFSQQIGPDPKIPGIARSCWVGAVGTLLWIMYVGLKRPPDNLAETKDTMIKWLGHDSVRNLVEFPMRTVRDWADLSCKLVHLILEEMEHEGGF